MNNQISNKKRREIMQETLKNINKIYGNSRTIYGKDMNQLDRVNTLSTNSLSCDYVLGGGFSNMVEIVGYPSAGKTTLALTAAAKLQKENPYANILFVDAEFCFDPDYAKALGVNVDDIIVCKPDTSEEAYNIIEEFIRSGVADLVILDSIAAMIPSEYTDKEIGKETKIASFAKLTTQAIQRINRYSAQYHTHVIFINQYKDAVTVNGFPGGSGTVMGNTNKYTPGGPSKDFFFHQIAEIKRVGQIKEKVEENGKKVEKTVANVIQITTLKNKISTPYRKGQFTIRFGKGLDAVQEVIGLGITLGFIKMSGAYYTILDENGNAIGSPINGRTKLADFLSSEDNVDLFNSLHDRIQAALEAIDDPKQMVKIDNTNESSDSKDEDNSDCGNDEDDPDNDEDYDET